MRLWPTWPAAVWLCALRALEQRELVRAALRIACKRATQPSRILGGHGSSRPHTCHPRAYRAPPGAARFIVIIKGIGASGTLHPRRASAVPTAAALLHAWGLESLCLQSERNDPLNQIDPDGQQSARLYGRNWDVEPGFAVVLGREGRAKHIAIVAGFARNSSGGLDAYVWEFGPITERGRRDLVDPTSARQSSMTLSNSNAETAGAGIWNLTKTQPMAVFINYKTMRGGVFTASEVAEQARNALGGGGCSYSNQVSGVSAGGQADCAAAANLLLKGLNGTLSGQALFGGGLSILEWQERVRSWWWHLQKAKPQDDSDQCNAGCR